MRSISRISSAAALLIVILSATSCAPAYSSGTSHTYLGFSIGVSNAPPPPRLAFYGYPHRERVEYTEVQVVESPDPGCDLFSYQGAFYLYSGGYWYRGDATTARIASSRCGGFHTRCWSCRRSTGTIRRDTTGTIVISQRSPWSR